MNDIAGGELCNMATIVNQRGMHARAAAKFVKTASAYRADVTVTKDDIRVSAKSIMGLMMLAAAMGTTINICGSGSDAADAVAALADLVARKFDEE